MKQSFIAILIFISITITGYSQCPNLQTLIDTNPLGRNLIFADLDEDGDQDILYPAHKRFEIYYYKNDGLGNYPTRDTIPIPGLAVIIPTQLIVNDIDGDSDLDIIVYTGTILRILENTAGTFTLANELITISQTSACRDCISIEDFDYDGDQDILINLGNDGAFYKNNGSLSFTYQLMCYQAKEHSIADVNNDGFVDILTAVSNQIWVNHNTGSGFLNTSNSIQYGASYPGGNNEIELIDYDYDGDLDAVKLDEVNSEIKIHINDGTGDFSISTSVFNGSYDIERLRMALINNDTIPDIVFAELNYNLGYPAGNIVCLLGANGSYGPPQTLYSGFLGKRYLEFEDIDQDGFAEMFIGYDSTQYLEELRIYSTDASLTYSNWTNLDKFDQLWRYNVKMVDLNSDGHNDFLGPPHCYINNGNDEFNGIQFDTTYPSSYGDFEFADFNGDGFLDLVATRSTIPGGSSTPNRLFWRPNNGAGLFGLEEILATNLDMDHIELYDVDLDGNIDITYTFDNSGDYEVRRILSDGAGNFSVPVGYFGVSGLNLGGISSFETAPANNVPFDVQAVFNGYAKVNNVNIPISLTGWGFETIYIVDVDNDGLRDIVMGFSTEFNWQKNLGNGTFSPPIVISSGLQNINIICADMDNDGLVDIACESTSQTEIYWLKNMGNGIFSPPITIIIEETIIAPEEFMVEDFDLDGRMDIMFNSDWTADKLVAVLNESTPGSPMAPVLFQETSCDSLTWSFNGQTYSNNGVYVGTINGSNGCDSVALLTLNLNSDNIQSAANACGSYFWSATNTTYTSSGNYSTVFTNALGCDSTLSLDLTINSLDSVNQNETACTDYTWPVNNITYTSTGFYSETFQNQFGCDSVRTLDLIVAPTQVNTVDITSCNNYYWPVTGITYYQDGTYSYVDTGIFGCDSTLNLNLTINTVDVSTTVINDTTIIANASGQLGYQWVDCDDNYAVLTGEIFQEFEANVDGNFAVIVTDQNTNCIDTSACFNVDYFHVGIEEISNAEFSIYPNPTNNLLNVQLNSSIINAEILIFDSSGKKLLQRFCQNESLIVFDISGLSHGYYFIEVKSELSVHKKSFIRN
jgi:hypothetical protein